MQKMSKKCRNHSPEFKSKVALAAITITLSIMLSGGMETFLNAVVPHH
jgi:hypothetical protein